jgi:ribosomal protein S24E
MSMIETLRDENNSFLSRREIVCDFNRLGGKLKKLEAVEMITKELKLDGKVVIPIKLQNHTGQPKITGTFYVYDDEKTVDAEPAKADAEPAKADAATDKPDAKNKSEKN